MAALGGGGSVTLGDLSELDEDDIDDLTLGVLERKRLRRAVKSVRQMGAMADEEVLSRSQARLRLAGMVVGLPLGIIAINRYGYQVSAVFSVAQRVKRS